MTVDKINRSDPSARVHHSPSLPIRNAATSQAIKWSRSAAALLNRASQAGQSKWDILWAEVDGDGGMVGSPRGQNLHAQAGSVTYYILESSTEAE
jgi:hypothetical protein